jgi:hypothetical protein
MAKRRERVSEATVRRLHALVMGGGKARVKATPYRDGQSVILDVAPQPSFICRQRPRTLRGCWSTHHLDQPER